MLNWVVTFFLLAIVASVFGFSGIAGTFAQISRFLAIIFIVLFAASLIYGLIISRRPPSV